MALISLDRMQEFLDIPAAGRILLEKSEKEITFSVNLKTGPDQIIFCDAFLVYHNVVLGPAKGGVRISPLVTLEETRTLAQIMTYKNALMGLPFGGGKSGIKVDMNALGEFSRIALIKEFVHQIREELSAGYYVPAPDLGSNPNDMAVIYGETHKAESVTGKPVRIGGLPGRREATGRGVFTAARLAAEKILKRNLAKTTAAIQGFGNVGSWTAYFLNQAGAKVVAVSDIKGGILNEYGLDLEALLQSPGRPIGSLGECSGGEKISNEELLKLKVDILIPAAVENVLTEKTSRGVQAEVVIEAANDPTTPEGDRGLETKGITVLPDFFCNSGGVIASYIEWRNARSGNQTEQEEVFDFIDRKIERTFEKIVEIKKRLGVTYRTAATYLALNELLEAMRERAWL